MNSTATMFIPELGMIEPRPCHEHFPMKPRSWLLTDVTAWGADFRFDLVGVDRRSGASAPADGSRRGRHHLHCPTRGRLWVKLRRTEYAHMFLLCHCRLNRSTQHRR